MVTAHSSLRGQRDVDKRHLVVLATHEKMAIEVCYVIIYNRKTRIIEKPLTILEVNFHLA